MTEQELNTFMGKVLLDSIKLEYECDSNQHTTFEASNRHQSQIRSMLKNPLGWAMKRSQPLWKNVLRRVAVAVLVITVGFGSVMAVSPTVRAAVIRWVIEWYETYIDYQHVGEELDEKMPHYDITGLGNDYVETDRTVSDQVVSVLYENESGDIVCFDYNYLHDGSFEILNSNDDDVVEVRINRSDGLLFVPHDPQALLTITWIDEQENMQFSVIANLSEKEIIRIAESIRIKK